MRIAILVAAVLTMNSAAVRADTETTIQATLEGVPSGVAVVGVSDDGFTSITVRPLRTWKSKTGHYCREYSLSFHSAVAREEISVRCREPDGRWAALN